MWASQYYQVRVVVTANNEFELFGWSQWREIVPILEPIVERIAGGKASMRSHQTRPDQQSGLPFGRMVWNRSNNERWTTKYQMGDYADGQTTFFSTEVFSPDWAKVWKNGTPLDLYLRVDNGMPLRESMQGLTIAIREPLYEQHQRLIEENCLQLLRIVPDARVYRVRRMWGESVWANGYTSGIDGTPSWKLVEGIKAANDRNESSET